MRMTNVRGYSFAMMAMLAVCGQAAAAGVTCPAASNIKDLGISNAGTDEEGTDYIATEGGKTWKGSVSAFDNHKADLKTLSAGSGSVSGTGLVVCDYSNKGAVTLRLTMDASNTVTPSK